MSIYFGTIEGKERKLGTLRRFLTQNKEKYFNQNFDNFRSHLLELYMLSELGDRLIDDADKTDQKLYQYLIDIFSSYDELNQKLYLLIPRERDVLATLLPDSELNSMFEDAMDNLYTKLIHFDEHVSYFADFYEEVFQKLFETKMRTPEGKMSLRVEVVRFNCFLSSHKNYFLLRRIVDNLSTKAINGLLLDFYKLYYGEDYYENHKIDLPIADDETEIKLISMEFDVMNPAIYRTEINETIHNFNFKIEISGIGIIEFDSENKPLYKMN